MRILVGEPDPAALERLLGLLRSWHFEPEGYVDGRRAWEALLADTAPRFVLWHARTLGLDGLELARRLREAELAARTYLLLMVPRDGSDTALAGLEAGADDCLHLPLDAEELRLRIQVGRRTLHLREKIHGLEAALRQQSARDGLTQVYNRRAIAELVDKELARNRRAGEWLTVVALDLDGFRRWNEELGEAAGDDLLREVVHRLRTAVRASDFVGRNVAAKFFLVLPGCNVDRGIATAERVRRAFCDRPVVLPSGALEVTASLGVAADRGGALAGEELLQRAVEELQRARAEGNCVRFAPPAVQGELPIG